MTETTVRYNPEQVHILHLIGGARQARGLTVIIDVFRAFSLECYLFHMGARGIRPVGTLEEAFAAREADPDVVLIGERGGRKCEGFDFGNSPSSIPPEAVRGREIIHTTSAGTQGVVNAAGAGEILTGSLVNARAVAEYIRKRRPGEVSLVCMGVAGRAPAPEDELCGEYIKSLLTGDALADFPERVRALRFRGGEHFFDPAMQDVYPEEDFRMCTRADLFPFVIRIEREGTGFRSRKIT